MARGIERPVRVYLRAARPMEHQINLLLATRAAELRGALYGETVRWKRRRTTKRHLQRLYRDVAPLIFAGEQIAVRAAVDSMARHGAVKDKQGALSRALINNGSEDRIAYLQDLLARNFDRATQLMDRDVPDLINPNTRGGIAHAIERIVRFESNEAFHRASIDAVSENPAVVGMRWNLSRTHTVRDVCNEYAERGVFAVHSVPNKPHPWCLCYVTPELAR